MLPGNAAGFCAGSVRKSSIELNTVYKVHAPCGVSTGGVNFCHTPLYTDSGSAVPQRTGGEVRRRMYYHMYGQGQFFHRKRLHTGTVRCAVRPGTGQTKNERTMCMKKCNWKCWIKCAGIRALKTVAQTAVATMGTSAVLAEVNWTLVASASALAGIMSLLTSLGGIPEVSKTDDSSDT